MVDLLVRSGARDDSAAAVPAGPVPAPGGDPRGAADPAGPADPANPPVPVRPVSPGFEWPRAARGVQAAFRGHSYRQDVVLALTVFLLTLLPSQAGQGSELLHASALLVVTSVLSSAAVIWRRAAPVTMYTLVLAACTAEWAGAQSSATDISWMICLYTVARYRSMRTLRFALGAIVPALAVLFYRMPPVQGPILVSLFFLGTGIAASAALGLMARERQAQLAALAERAHHAEQEREQRARLAVLAERARFSRETHDIVGHSLAVIIGLADGGARQVEAHPWRGRQVFELIAETSRQSLSDLRHTLGALREHGPGRDGDGIGGFGGLGGIGAEAFSPQPGMADISDLLDRTRSAGPRVSCRTSGETAALPRGLQSAVYRIVQESLTNCLKHAGPDTNVRVVIEADARTLKLSIADTGPAGVRRGLSAPPDSRDSRGQGLAGVRERAALAGGKAEAGPNEAGGWTVAARFPLLPAGEV
ncbi:sensor histidine kinase [Catenulispora pinisilvae]|uniref:sensor histidine kinase n=1 Tax=Catenulispora pinisilvae TaxID=2705253 RepID=UPI00189215C5|nr:histidine kinase [Catenulispora pinisilvae]